MPLLLVPELSKERAPLGSTWAQLAQGCHSLIPILCHYSSASPPNYYVGTVLSSSCSRAILGSHVLTYHNLGRWNLGTCPEHIHCTYFYQDFIQINIFPFYLSREGLVGFASVTRDWSEMWLLWECPAGLRGSSNSCLGLGFPLHGSAHNFLGNAEKGVACSYSCGNPDFSIPLEGPSRP